MRRGDVIYPTTFKGKHVITWVFISGVMAKKVLKNGTLSAHEHAFLRSEIGQHQLNLLEVR